MNPIINVQCTLYSLQDKKIIDIYIYNIIKQHVIQIGMHEAACLIGERGGTVYQRFKSQIRFKPNIYR